MKAHCMMCYWLSAHDRIYYNIVNTSGGDEVMLYTGSAHRGCPLHTWYPKSVNVAQRWEFIVPVVAIPAGWVQIQNLSTFHVLTHKYLCIPPVAMPPPEPCLPHNRETWGAQWSFQIAVDRQSHPTNLGGVSWIIKNRLTEGGFVTTNTGMDHGQWTHRRKNQSTYIDIQPACGTPSLSTMATGS